MVDGIQYINSHVTVQCEIGVKIHNGVYWLFPLCAEKYIYDRRRSQNYIFFFDSDDIDHRFKIQRSLFAFGSNWNDKNE